MQITFKTITQELLKIEADPKEIMQQLKQKIEKEKRYEDNRQRFVYAGNISRQKKLCSK